MEKENNKSIEELKEEIKKKIDQISDYKKLKFYNDFADTIEND